jgi:hypothetical protein
MPAFYGSNVLHLTPDLLSEKRIGLTGWSVREVNLEERLDSRFFAIFGPNVKKVADRSHVLIRNVWKVIDHQAGYQLPLAASAVKPFFQD